MKGGKLSDFIEYLHYGSEMVFLYNKKKYFIEGWRKRTTNKYELLLYNVTEDRYDWEYLTGKTSDECAEKFLAEKIFDGKTFNEIEQNVTWADWDDEP